LRLERVTLDRPLAQRVGVLPAIGGAAVVGVLVFFGLLGRASALNLENPVPLRWSDAFYSGKQATAEFFFARLLPRTLSLEASIRGGSQSLYGLAAEQF
ncbi:acyl-CoA dehydrogenase C-terminal domain-containing protein, partial [Escherichia coli]